MKEKLEQLNIFNASPSFNVTTTNFEIQKYYENYPKFSGVYSRNNLSKVKDGHI